MRSAITCDPLLRLRPRLRACGAGVRGAARVARAAARRRSGDPLAAGALVLRLQPRRASSTRTASSTSASCRPTRCRSIWRRPAAPTRRSTPTRGRLVDAEVAAARPQRPALVFADIPALAFDVAAAARRAGRGDDQLLLGLDLRRLRRASCRRSRRWSPACARRTRAPRCCCACRCTATSSAFPRIRDMPLVARRARGRARDDVRARLDLPRARPPGAAVVRRPRPRARRARRALPA